MKLDDSSEPPPPPPSHRTKIRAGLKKARRRGVQLGRPRQDFDAERAQQLMEAGLTAEETAKVFDTSRATLFRRIAEAKGPAQL